MSDRDDNYLDVVINEDVDPFATDPEEAARADADLNHLAGVEARRVEQQSLPTLKVRARAAAVEAERATAEYQAQLYAKDERERIEGLRYCLDQLGLYDIEVTEYPLLIEGIALFAGRDSYRWELRGAALFGCGHTEDSLAINYISDLALLFDQRDRGMPALCTWCKEEQREPEIGYPGQHIMVPTIADTLAGVLRELIRDEIHEMQGQGELP